VESERFQVEVPDEVLVDLRERLARTRWPGEVDNASWRYGAQVGYLRELMEYWAEGFDWREQERAINAFSHYRTRVGEVPIHFIHEPGHGPAPLPLVLSHGWPWTFWDFNKVIRPLADPAASGGDPADAFHVVVPSLPGFAFSTPLERPGVNAWGTADLWVELMTRRLGYERFGAHGGDWGAAVTAQLGHKHAERLVGIHLSMPVNLHIDPKTNPLPSDYGPEEAGWYEHTARFWERESGYYAEQSSKPQTLAFGLNDSPVGLAAWLVEKRRAWSDCDGDVERRFSKDELCTNLMLYWATQSIGSSVRYYYEADHAPWQPAHHRTPVVEAPAGVAIFPKDVVLMPRRWAERHYDLRRWTVMPAGGHFAPMEEPERLVDDLRAFFRPLRSGIP
jgi:pimeloyl-ACP methyl ester carboxylesterase